jgi:predicted nucleic acid-binding protein
MTATVIDASALAAYMLHEEGSEPIGQYLVEGVDSIGLVFKETASAILAAEKNGRIDRSQAEVCMEALRTVIGHNVRAAGDQEGLLWESYELARRYGTTIYDALYVVLAKSLGAKLVTRDANQSELAIREGVEIGP